MRISLKLPNFDVFLIDRVKNGEVLYEYNMHNTAEKHFSIAGRVASRLYRQIFLSPTLIPLSGVGTTCFSSCCDKDSAIIFTTGRLPEVNPP
jgi:hypothetical protein